jgi:hypothetical protein
MFQRYPSSGKAVEPDRPPAPSPVQNAVKLMYTGAAVSTVSLIISIINIGSAKAAFKKAHPNLTTAQANQLNSYITASIISGIVGIVLWLWMARANGQGREWARVLSSVLFGLNTLGLLLAFSQRTVAIVLVFPVLIWLVGLGAVILLWRRESTEFFKPPGTL